MGKFIGGTILGVGIGVGIGFFGMMEVIVTAGPVVCDWYKNIMLKTGTKKDFANWAEYERIMQPIIVSVDETFKQ